MLNSFRAFSGSIVTKILMGVLILSFALWGIGGLMGTSVGGHTLAKVGSQNISIESYRRELAMESDRVRRQLGANYSQELLKRLNVPQFVLRRMVQESLLQQEAKRMGFIPDDTTVALEIRKTPAFINHSGVFDKARFDSTLRNQGVSENTYVERLRMQIATDKLLDALAIELPVTDTMLSTLQAAYAQGRTITLYRLSPQAFATGQPTDAELQEFQKTHAEQFTIPEYRTVSFVRLVAPSAQAQLKQPSEERIRGYYEAHADQFRTPEKRDVEQLLYNSEEKAREAYEQVKLGKKFSEIAASIQPLNAKNLSLSNVEKKALPESAAERVFTLKVGGFTEPLKSAFGWHVFRVANITPEGEQPLEKVRPQVVQALQQEGLENALTDQMNQMEDALAGGSTLSEAAKTMGLSVEQAGTFNKEGKTPQGTVDQNIPQLDKFVDVAFKTEEKTESSLIASKGGVYYVLRVDTITPEKLRPFAQAKDDIIEAFKQYKGSKAAADAASEIESSLSKGKKAAEVIAEHKLSSSISGTVGRGSKTLGDIYLPPSFVSSIFSADIGALTTPAREKDGGYLIAQVTGVANVSLEASAMKLSKKDLSQQMQEEMMIQYLRHLETLYPVDIRQDVLDQLVQEPGDAAR